MTHDLQQAERRLEQALRHEAMAAGPATLSLDDVRGRARTIRRRRRAGLAGALVAAAAAAAPFLLLAGGPQGSRAVDPAEQAPRPVPHVLGDRLVVDGEEVRLDVPSEVDGLAELEDGRLVVSVSDGPDRLAAVVTRDGSLESTHALSGSPVGSESGAAAWLSPDGSTWLLLPGEDDPRPLPRVTLQEPAVSELRCQDDLCTVFVTGFEAGRPATMQVDSTGRSGPVDGFPTVLDVSADGGLQAGLAWPAPDEVHACGGVLDVASGSQLWESCEHSTYAFSPDAAHLAATFSEGLGPTYVALLDAATGDEVTRLGDVGLVWSLVWEDAEHLLAGAFDDGAWWVVRLGVDGTTETVAGPYPAADELSAPVVLPTR